MRKKIRERKKGDSWKFPLFSLILLMLFILLVYYSTFSGLKPYLDDADAYSYRAVIPPMFVIILLFFYRKDLQVDKDSKRIIFAIPLFAIAAALLYSANYWPLYMLDTLSLPFFVAGSILLFFSIPTFKKLLFMLLYLFLLWAPLFQPLVLTQQTLTNLTADFVNIPFTVLNFSIERDGNIFRSGSKISLEIVPQCVSLSSMIALFCFLLPFAYVAKGDVKSKMLWLALWLVGAWMLNALRIILVLLIWYYSGVSAALQVFHALGWNILFDLTLVASLASLVLFKLFGLELKL